MSEQEGAQAHEDVRSLAVAQVAFQAAFPVCLQPSRDGDGRRYRVLRAVVTALTGK